MLVRLLCRMSVFVAATTPAFAQPRVLDAELHHLRIDGPREWSSFPESPEAASLELAFEATPNEREATLRVRQQDVKQTWRVRLNDDALGTLISDENDLVLALPVPPQKLKAGRNVLRIEPQAGPRSAPDDIRVGEVSLDLRPMREVLGEASLDITVTEDSNDAIPCRITIVDERGSLTPLDVEPAKPLAVRTGVIYTADGKARCGVPAGKYTVYAGRGFEYSLAKSIVEVSAGETKSVSLSIRREVPTNRWIACDTHIHTLTDSGHGDASVEERMVTLAGEGIELAIATDHNVQIDQRSVAERVGVRKYFTTVVGNEVTTPVGHFNIFPLEAGGPRPDPQHREWPPIFDEIQKTKAGVVILNHARDLHSNFRPFDPKHFNAAVGTQLDGWPIGFNAMEVVNSGATQTDPMRLFHDWMTLLNTGHDIAPIGSSDSHDVTRFIVGQGRTYIRGDDSDPSEIDIGEAVANIRRGQVRVSYGLLAELTVGDVGPGELAKPAGDELKASVRVLGPSWVKADRVALFMNGVLVRDEEVTEARKKELPDGVKFDEVWTLPKPPHDVHLVAIASGPGIHAAYWPTAKPYQPTSPEWTAHVLGCSGAVWIDGDGDGKKTAARDYARGAYDAAKGDLGRLVVSLNEYDAAVAAQAAAIFHEKNPNSFNTIAQPLDGAALQVGAGFAAYIEAERASVAAQIESR